MTTALLLIPALVLDAIFGEPKWIWSNIPHPAVLMGRLVSLLDRSLNHDTHRKAKGMLAVIVLVAVGLALGRLLSSLPDIGKILIVAVLIAQRSLVDHLGAVATGLARNLPEGRAAVAMIVSRDTAQMTGPQVARAAIESGAENFSDGVIAPAFWFLIAGLPGILIYKLINTADSMIGYRTEKYEDFGWAAARLDDLLNWLPARLSALLIALVSAQLRRWSAIIADAQLHRSPNAGWPEAAMARAVGVSLAGPRSYDGKLQDFAWVHDAGHKHANAGTIRHTNKKLWFAWALALLLVVAISPLF